MEVDQFVAHQTVGHHPSKVAALMIRFRRVMGPSLAGSKTCAGTPVTLVRPVCVRRCHPVGSRRDADRAR